MPVTFVQLVRITGTHLRLSKFFIHQLMHKWIILNAIFKIHFKIDISLIPNSAKDIHQGGPNNTCSHTTELTAPMHFNWLF